MPGLLIFLLVVIVIICANLRVVPQAQVYVIERLGKFRTAWAAGLHLLLPLFDKVAKKVDLKEQVLDFPPQGVITKDNVTMRIDSVVYLRVINPQLFAYGAQNPIAGVENLAATTLRNIVGSLDFDGTLTSRELINAQMEKTLDEATDPWGIKVTRVEVKDIQPPAEIQEVMTKQMRAEREKRQAILESEAHKQSIVTRAEGDKRAVVLQAEADRDAAIARAEGEARSIELVYAAQANGLAKLSSVAVSEPVLRLKQLEALKDVANGSSTKIFIPTDMAECVGATGVVGDLLQSGLSQPEAKIAEEPAAREDPCLHEGSSPISVAAAEQQGYET